ncbi:MAG: hypothetical protein GC179_18470 [Anaerolineaceae bacterium]|nr:hypothetical protein [Anaerolineaceae bacterium]
MTSSNVSSDCSSKSLEVRRVLTDEEKAAMRERLAALPSPEEMKQKAQQLLDNLAEIGRLCEMLLDEKRR